VKRLALAVIGLLASLQLLLYGCGDRLLTVNVDILSFMDPTVVELPYGGPGHIIPAHGLLPIVFEAPPQDVNLTEGLAEVTDVQSVTLHVSSQLANQTGNAKARLQVFISDTLTNPYDTTPCAQDSIQLEPATVDTMNVDVLGDQRVAELLTGEAVRVGIRTTFFDMAGSPENVTGVETLIRFTAAVVAKRHIP
jgi:hypothetical protein